jgi:transcriptional regulator
MKKMMRLIVPIAFDVGAIEGTWKLSQNKSDLARLSAVDGMTAADMGAEMEALNSLMKDPPC